MSGAAIHYDYTSPGPVVDELLRSDAFVTGIRGPIGSGKSTGCVMKLLQIATAQPVQKDGRRHSRILVVRNTYAELKTTTIKTWHMWIPETIGHWVAQGPPMHRIIDDELDMEVIFLALDRPRDVKKVLSMDLTAAWVNEAREVSKAVIDGLTGRVGRFPSMRDGGCVNPCIVMDTNSPEVDHWWYVLAEQDTTTARNEEMVKSIAKAEEELRAAGLLRRNQPLFRFLSQPDANSPDAENRANLPADYYAKLSAGKSEEWIKVYVRGEYGFVQDGRPVYPEFRESLHVKVFELNPKIGLTIGIDFGNTPAATIGQRTFTGIQRVRWEIVTEHMGAKQFAVLLKGFLSSPPLQRFSVDSITGDPAGESESQTDIDETCFKILNANGIEAKPAHTNDPIIRQEAHKQAMTRLIDGEAGYQIHPSCSTLRRGMAGQYRFRRVQVTGIDDRYHAKPEKNSVSHVCEADQYRMLGSGEGRVVLRGTVGGARRRFAYSET